MEKIENEKIYRIILAIFTAVNISIITIFCFFCIGLSRVEAKTWIQINDTNGNMVCGSSSDIKDCTYGELKNGSYTYKKLNDYLIILEDLEKMKSNNTYEIELTWTLKTYALNNNETSWITRNNYYTFTSYTQMNLQGSNGQLVDDSTKAWSLVGWSLTGTSGTNSSFANLAYNYSNTFTPTTDTDRIVLRITKRSRWESIGTYKDFYGVSPEIEITNLTYTIRNISASNQDIITNANQNTQDIMNNQNQNTDKVVGAIEGEGLEDTKPINPDKKEELEGVEKDLLKEDVITSLNDIDISIDTNSNEFIWNLVTRIINTNSLIFGLVLTMLSLGVLKLVLNR